MTINVALVTGEALIMGCDSIASSTQPLVDPFARPWLTNEKGELVRDKDGNYFLPVAKSDIRQTVSNLVAGVTKMFLIHESPSIVATTAGAAKLNSKTMKVLAEIFCAQQASSKNKLVNVEPVANAFLKFIRKEFIQQYKGSNIPEEFREGPEFLVGGYGRDDDFPSLFRLIPAANRMRQEFAAGESGLSWNGQADSVERMIRGCDSALIKIVDAHVDTEFSRHHDEMNKAVLRIVSDLLTHFEAELPDGINTSLPGRLKTRIPWDEVKLSIDYSNMPLQNAIDFVSWLVLTQSGRAKFARGLPTVGGRTHIGVVTKGEGLQLLGEPLLEHRYTGFSHDL